MSLLWIENYSRRGSTLSSYPSLVLTIFPVCISWAPYCSKSIVVENGQPGTSGWMIPFNSTATDSPGQIKGMHQPLA